MNIPKSIGNMNHDLRMPSACLSPSNESVHAALPKEAANREDATPTRRLIIPNTKTRGIDQGVSDWRASHFFFGGSEFAANRNAIAEKQTAISTR